MSVTGGEQRNENEDVARNCSHSDLKILASRQFKIEYLLFLKGLCQPMRLALWRYVQLQ